MPVRKNDRTKKQGAETKKLLYACAEELFRQCEYSDVSVDAITKKAGVTKGTFYVHFESKTALYGELFATYAAQMDEQYADFLYSLPPEMSSADRMLAFIDKIIDLMTTQIGYDRLRTVYRLQLTDTMNMECVKGYERKLYTLFETLLAHGLRQNEFQTDLSLKALTRLFVMAIRGLTYEWCIRYPDFDFKEAAAAQYRLLLSGIRADASGVPARHAAPDKVQRH